MNLSGLSGSPLAARPWASAVFAALLPAVLATTIPLLAGCASNEPELAAPDSGAAEGSSVPDGLLSSAHMGDPRAAPQLLEGFYGLEQGVWRWTARKFVVALQAPSGGEGQDTQLEFSFTLPEAVISRLKEITLTARVNGTDVGSESYTQPGEYVFTKPVPANLLHAGGAAKVEFEMDKALPPGEADKRELGLVAVSVALK
jgi:hypothetical protein